MSARSERSRAASASACAAPAGSPAARRALPRLFQISASCGVAARICSSRRAASACRPSVWSSHAWRRARRPRVREGPASAQAFAGLVQPAEVDERLGEVLAHAGIGGTRRRGGPKRGDALRAVPGLATHHADELEEVRILRRLPQQPLAGLAGRLEVTAAEQSHRLCETGHGRRSPKKVVSRAPASSSAMPP